MGPPVGKRLQKSWSASGNGKISLDNREIEWPGLGEVLVRVRAAGLCGSDLAQIDEDAIAPLQATSVLGLEVSGEVVAVGPSVSCLAEGDRVCCLLSGGGFAEFCTCPASFCLPIPSNYSWQEAAALPVALVTGIASKRCLIIHHRDVKCRLDSPVRSRADGSWAGGDDPWGLRRGWTHDDSIGEVLRLGRHRNKLEHGKGPSLHGVRCRSRDISGHSRCSEHDPKLHGSFRS